MHYVRAEPREREPIRVVRLVNHEKEGRVAFKAHLPWTLEAD
jgi:hypothetical protein